MLGSARADTIIRQIICEVFQLPRRHGIGLAYLNVTDKQTDRGISDILWQNRALRSISLGN